MAKEQGSCRGGKALLDLKHILLLRKAFLTLCVHYQQVGEDLKALSIVLSDLLGTHGAKDDAKIISAAFGKDKSPASPEEPPPEAPQNIDRAYPEGDPRRNNP